VREVLWANEQRTQLTAEIQALLCNSAEEDRDAEVVGLLPAQDRLDDLRRRLVQIESLISATKGEPHERAKSWSAEFGDPRPN
jgi:hypothetical protein